MEIQRIVDFEYQQPEPGFLHHGSSHSHWQLRYVVSGGFHAVVDGVDLPLSQGELVLCAPEQFHMVYAQEGQSPGFLSIIFDCTGLPPTLPAGKVISAGALAPILEQMAREPAAPDGYTQAMMAHLLSAVMLQLCRDALGAPAVSPSVRTARGENDIIRRAQQHISAHIREKLSVTLVAKRIDVSPSYMTALFHKHLSIAPGEYIRRAKLQESKRLIQEGAMNFTEIAAALEYSTVHHFSRQFKEHFGITPTEYAKQVGTKGA